MDTLPWIEKYRPTHINSVLGHEETIQTIKCFLAKGQLPHILLHGPPGTGKTSLVQAISKEMYGPSAKQMILELNASDDRGIGVVRNQIRTFAETRPPLYNRDVPDTQRKITNNENLEQATTSGNHVDLFAFFPRKSDAAGNNRSKIEIHPKLSNLKLVILDEVDQMTAAAQTALRRIMEKYASQVRFFLMCNDVGKINPPIQSRCTKFRLPPLKDNEINTKLQQLISQEKIQITEDGVHGLLSTCNGDMRRLVNTIQACQLSKPTDSITRETVLDVLGLPSGKEIDEIFQLLCTGTLQEGFDALFTSICQRGSSLTDIIAAIYERVIHIDWINTSALTLFPRLSKIQTAVSGGGSEIVHAAAVVAAFIEVRTDLKSHGVASINDLKPFEHDVCMA